MDVSPDDEATRVQALNELVNLPVQEKEALGIAATAGEIAQQPLTWLGTRRIFEQHRERLGAFLEAAGITGPLERRPHRGTYRCRDV